MMMKTGHRLVLSAALLCLPAAHAQSITKCQDEEGNWHYGDFAAEACAEQGTVTEIDERGRTVRETQPPPTADELEAAEAAQRAQRERAEREAREREANQRLLRTYDSAQDIIDARDARLEAIDNELAGHRLFRGDLEDEKARLLEGSADPDRLRRIEAQIEQYDEAIRGLKQERRAMKERYNKELERYRELTGE